MHRPVRLLLLGLALPRPALAASWVVDRYGTGDFTTIQGAIDASDISGSGNLSDDPLQAS